jgi:hypothetical protein
MAKRFCRARSFAFDRKISAICSGRRRFERVSRRLNNSAHSAFEGGLGYMVLFHVSPFNVANTAWKALDEGGDTIIAFARLFRREN